MKKKVLTVVSSVLLASSVATVLPQELQPIKSQQAHAASCYATQYVSKKAVKEIAANRAKLANGTEGISILAGVLGKWSVPAGLAIWADKNRTLRNTKVFADAAKQNKRVKITFCNGPTPNLPNIKYSIVS